MKRITSLILLIMLCIPLAAESAEYFKGTIQEPYENELPVSSLGKIVDYNISNNAVAGFSSHKMNYLLPCSYSITGDGDGEQKAEVKFQMSVKQRLLKFYGWAFYFAYSQKSFWQAYDLHNSRPFRENNFNPEIFLRSRMWEGFRADLAMEHESNGREEPYSRSWNRIYLKPYFENEYAIVYLKGWYRFKEKTKSYPLDPGGDENPEINKYYGYCELGFTVKVPSVRMIYISSVIRFNPAYGHGAEEINITIPMISNSMGFMLHYWEGYGESLIDYNVYQRKIGAGFNITL
ncbi:MAG TPA: phospholipase A [Spirochaetota bacterium]|nr:phospholipase A [Spirochaetota bacterium]